MNPQQQAQLQSLGINLYQAVNTIDVANVLWLADVCALLNIPTKNCVFDANQAHFDETTQQLHLPSIFYSSEIELKKSIWRNIQSHVNKSNLQEC